MPRESGLPQIGDRFGRWTVCGESRSRPGGQQVPVRCDCGREERRPPHILRKGKSTQCRDCADAARTAPLRVALKQLEKLTPAELQQLSQSVSAALAAHLTKTDF